MLIVTDKLMREEILFRPHTSVHIIRENKSLQGGEDVNAFHQDCLHVVYQYPVHFSGDPTKGPVCFGCLLVWIDAATGKPECKHTL